MKKITVFLLTGLMAASMLSGCSSSSEEATTAATTAAAAEAEDSGDTAEGETTASAGEGTNLIMTWWGNQVRNERTQNALNLYMEQNPGVTIDGQFSEWADYWNKLATNAAGNALPDIIQMDYMYVDQYVKSGLLLDLTPYIEDGTLDTSEISENTMLSGTVDGGVYAICAGINSPALFYNKTLTDQLGLEIKDNMTMDEFFEVCRQVYEQTGVKTSLPYGSVNSYSSFFVRSFDFSMFEDGGIGGTAEGYIPFFEQYTRGLEEGWLIDAGVYAEISVGSVEQSPMVYGTSTATQSWCTFANSNQFTAIQNAAPEGMEVAITTWPAYDPVKSDYLKSGQFFSIGATTANPEESVKVLDFLINSEEANDILLGERGVPAPMDVAEYLTPKLSELDQEVVRFINEVVTPNCSPIDPPEPDGSNEVYELMNLLVEQVCYGQLSAEEAAEQFYAEATELMASKQQ